ncbi:MAG: glycosyltransferase [Aquabacterium sp.]|jgi:glycosyltransferase involved in cell wall biosynthesis|nr:glycosyltransferase [Aquabacterium sp.]|tara:strand:- start:1449 stop:2654 length:1206 start_codon:yes stop_codon:yes gene_type:complete
MGFRILHCIASVNPKGGGPIEGLKQLSAVNQQQGHQVEVLTLDSPDDPWVKDCPIPCHAVGPTLVGNWRYSPRWVPWLRAHAHGYDAVIVNGIWQYHAFGAWRALAGTKTPYFVFTHGMLDPWFKRTYPLKHLKKWLFWPWAEYRVLRDAAAVMFTCEDERCLARQSFWLYQCDEFVVSYGTSAPPEDEVRQREAFLQAFPDLQGKRLLLFLGRVHEKKGPDLLFKAFASLRARQPELLRDVRIVMAGPAEHAYGQEMLKLNRELGLADVTTWTGMISGDVKWGAFRASEAFILPSHQENFGIAVAEAMACGVPVLISNQVNIWREIQQSQGGLVEQDTHAGTERLLTRWLATPPEQWAQMRVNARQCFQQRFLIDRTAESFIEAMKAFGMRQRSAKPKAV